MVRPRFVGFRKNVFLIILALGLFFSIFITYNANTINAETYTGETHLSANIYEVAYATDYANCYIGSYPYAPLPEYYVGKTLHSIILWARTYVSDDDIPDYITVYFADADMVGITHYDIPKENIHWISGIIEAYWNYRALEIIVNKEIPEGTQYVVLDAHKSFITVHNANRKTFYPTPSSSSQYAYPMAQPKNKDTGEIVGFKPYFLILNETTEIAGTFSASEAETSYHWQYTAQKDILLEFYLRKGYTLSGIYIDNSQVSSDKITYVDYNTTHWKITLNSTLIISTNSVVDIYANSPNSIKNIDSPKAVSTDSSFSVTVHIEDPYNNPISQDITLEIYDSQDNLVFTGTQTADATTGNATFTIPALSKGQYTIYAKTGLDFAGILTKSLLVLNPDTDITISANIPDMVKYDSYTLTIYANNTVTNEPCEIYVNGTYLGTSPATYTITFDSLGQTTISLEIKAVYDKAEKTINWQDTTTVYDDIIATITVTPENSVYYPFDTVTISYDVHYANYPDNSGITTEFVIDGQTQTTNSVDYVIPEKDSITIYVNATDGITSVSTQKTLQIDRTITLNVDYNTSRVWYPHDTFIATFNATYGNGVQVFTNFSSNGQKEARYFEFGMYKYADTGITNIDTKQFTIIALIKGNITEQYSKHNIYVVGKFGSFAFRVSSIGNVPTLGLWVYNGTTSAYYGVSTNVLNDEWNVIAISVYNTTLKIYANGELLGVRTIALGKIFQSSSSIFVGAYTTNYGWFTGAIAHVLFYNVILTDSDICNITIDLQDFKLDNLITDGLVFYFGPNMQQIGPNTFKDPLGNEITLYNGVKLVHEISLELPEATECHINITAERNGIYAYYDAYIPIDTTLTDIVYTIDYPYDYFIPEDTAQITAYAIFGNGHKAENSTITIKLNENVITTTTNTAQTTFTIPYNNATILIEASLLGQYTNKTIYLPLVTGLQLQMTYTEAGPFYPHDTITIAWTIRYKEMDMLPKDLIVYVNTSLGQKFVFYDNNGLILELPEEKSYTITLEAVSRQFKATWSYVYNIDTRLSHIIYDIQYDYSVLIPEDSVLVTAQAYFYNGKIAENSTITVYLNGEAKLTQTNHLYGHITIPYTDTATFTIEATLFDSTISETVTYDVVTAILINASITPDTQYYMPNETAELTFSFTYDKLNILPKDLQVTVTIDNDIYTFTGNSTITITIPAKDNVIVNITAVSREFKAYWQKVLAISWINGQIYIDGAYDYAYIDISLEGQYHVIKEPLKAVMILTNKTIAPYSFTLPNAQQNNISIEDIVITQNITTVTFMAKVGNLEAIEVTTTVTIEFYTSRGTIYTFTDTYVIPASAYKQISFTFTLPNSFYGPIMAKITITNSLGQSLAIEYITPINPAGYYVISWNTFNTANYHYENVISKNATTVVVLASDYVNVASLEPIEANIQIPEASITTVSVVTDRSFYETGLTAQITITVNMTPDYPAKVLLYIDNTLVRTWNLTGNATLLYQYEITENYPLNVQYSIPVQVEVYNSISNVLKAENSTNIYIYNSGPTIKLISPAEYSDISGNVTIDLDITDLSGVAQVVYKFDFENDYKVLEPPYDININVSSLPNGMIYLEVRATDTHGYETVKYFAFNVYNPVITAKERLSWLELANKLSRYIFLPAIVVSFIVLTVGYVLGKIRTERKYWKLIELIGSKKR